MKKFLTLVLFLTHTLGMGQYVGNTGYLSVSSGLYVTGNLSNGGTVEMQVGSQTTVDGNLSNTGTFILKSPVDDGPSASLITYGTTSGSYSVERYVTSGRWWCFGPPVAGSTSVVYDATNVNNKLYYWNETATGWIRILDNTTTLDTRGYYFKTTSTPVTITFLGTLNTGVKLRSTTNTVGGPKQGWNMVTNPYPSSIDWDAAGWTKTYLYNIVWVRKNGIFASYNGATGIGINGGTREIASMQSFWVKDTVGGGQIGMTDAVRIHSASTPLKSEGPTNLVRLTSSSGSYSDEIVIHFDATSSRTNESTDTEKSFGDAIVPQLYTEALNGTDLALNTMNISELNTDLVIPVRLKTGTLGTVTVTATQVDLDPTITVSLEDVTNGITVDLRSTPSITVTVGTGDLGRFNLIFSKNPLPVELLNFSAHREGSTVVIEWKTASETGCDRFEVWRSGDGSDFTMVTEVRGAGWINSLSEYVVEDDDPLLSESYYRLTQVDFDGHSREYPPVYVSPREVIHKLSPNPTSGFVVIDSPDLGVTIVDMFGQTVLETTSDKNGRLDLSGLSSGIYTLLFRNGTRTSIVIGI